MDTDLAAAPDAPVVFDPTAWSRGEPLVGATCWKADEHGNLRDLGRDLDGGRRKHLTSDKREWFSSVSTNRDPKFIPCSRGGDHALLVRGLVRGWGRVEVVPGFNGKAGSGWHAEHHELVALVVSPPPARLRALRFLTRSWWGAPAAGALTLGPAALLSAGPPDRGLGVLAALACAVLVLGTPALTRSRALRRAAVEHRRTLAAVAAKHPGVPWFPTLAAAASVYDLVPDPEAESPRLLRGVDMQGGAFVQRGDHQRAERERAQVREAAERFLREEQRRKEEEQIRKETEQFRQRQREQATALADFEQRQETRWESDRFAAPAGGCGEHRPARERSQREQVSARRKEFERLQEIKREDRLRAERKDGPAAAGGTEILDVHGLVIRHNVRFAQRSG